MNPIVLLVFTVACSMASPVSYGTSKSTTSYVSPAATILKQINQLNDDGSYSFGFEASDGSFRIENMDVNGYITGRYGYIDGNGEPQETEYVAGKLSGQSVGYQSRGSLSSDVSRSQPFPVIRSSIVRSAEQKALDYLYNSVDDNEDGIPDRLPVRATSNDYDSSIVRLTSPVVYDNNQNVVRLVNQLPTNTVRLVGQTNTGTSTNTVRLVGQNNVGTSANTVRLVDSANIGTSADNVRLVGQGNAGNSANNIRLVGQSNIGNANTVRLVDSANIGTSANNVRLVGQTNIGTPANTVRLVGSTNVGTSANTVRLVGQTNVGTPANTVRLVDSGNVATSGNTVQLIGSSNSGRLVGSATPTIVRVGDSYGEISQIRTVVPAKATYVPSTGTNVRFVSSNRGTYRPAQTVVRVVDSVATNVKTPTIYRLTNRGNSAYDSFSTVNRQVVQPARQTQQYYQNGPIDEFLKGLETSNKNVDSYETYGDNDSSIFLSSVQQQPLASPTQDAQDDDSISVDSQ